MRRRTLTTTMRSLCRSTCITRLTRSDRTKNTPNERGDFHRPEVQGFGVGTRPRRNARRDSGNELPNHAGRNTPHGTAQLPVKRCVCRARDALSHESGRQQGSARGNGDGAVRGGRSKHLRNAVAGARGGNGGRAVPLLLRGPRPLSAGRLLHLHRGYRRQRRAGLRVRRARREDARATPAERAVGGDGERFGPVQQGHLVAHRDARGRHPRRELHRRRDVGQRHLEQRPVGDGARAAEQRRRNVRRRRVLLYDDRHAGLDRPAHHLRRVERRVRVRDRQPDGVRVRRIRLEHEHHPVHRRVGEDHESHHHRPRVVHRQREPQRHQILGVHRHQCGQRLRAQFSEPAQAGRDRRQAHLSLHGRGHGRRRRRGDGTGVTGGAGDAGRGRRRHAGRSGGPQRDRSGRMRSEGLAGRHGHHDRVPLRRRLDRRDLH